MLDAPMMWAIFGIVVVVMFALDLGIFNRGSKVISVKKSLEMTAFWIAISLAFALFVYFEMGAEASTEYVAAYVVEKAMSVDNLFVFLIIFAAFAVPDEYQHKALFYGIVGALAFRALFVFVGAELLETFHFVMYIFGALLIYTAVRTVIKKQDEDKESFVIRLSRRLKSSPDFDGDKLFTFRNGVRLATPLFICIIVIELTDIMFAFDSIPACLAISTDTFIVYTSNIFAILGLRSLYFALKGSMDALAYLKYGLGAILAFVGAKMLLSDVVEIPVVLSLAVILGILAVTVLASALVKRRTSLNNGI